MIERAFAKRTARMQTVDKCNDQLARLEPIYKRLSEIKKDLRSARKSTEKMFEEKGNWRGEKYVAYRSAGSELDGICGDYYKQLDAAHDAINVKIGELRAARAEAISDIGILLGQIERWSIELNNNWN